MLLGRFCFYGLCAAFVLFSARVGAQATSTEKAVLWYRSSEGCPDGAVFLALLGDRAAQVRLAQAGDRVDFVVNLALGPEGAQGRLERETARGTVAIREVEDLSCEKVAQVVALNLSLALEPGVPTQDAPEADATVEKGAPDPLTTTADRSKQTPSSESEASPATRRAEETNAKQPHPPRLPIRESVDQPERSNRVGWRLGLSGGLQSGLGDGFMGRGSIFLEARSFLSSLPNLTIRGAALAAFGSFETDIGTIGQSLWAGQLRVCPVAWSRAAITLDPCLTAELGQLSAAGPLSASALWAALGTHVQGRWSLSRRFSLEGDVGADFPLREYEIMAGSASLYRSAPVGFSALAGASVAF